MLPFLLYKIKSTSRLDPHLPWSAMSITLNDSLSSLRRKTPKLTESWGNKGGEIWAIVEEIMRPVHMQRWTALQTASMTSPLPQLRPHPPAYSPPWHPDTCPLGVMTPPRLYTLGRPCLHHPKKQSAFGPFTPEEFACPLKSQALISPAPENKNKTPDFLPLVLFSRHIMKYRAIREPSSGPQKKLPLFLVSSGI